MRETATRRLVLCSCGGDVFRKTVFDAPPFDPAWQCDNCSAMTPRLRRSRPSNHQRALDAWKTIRAEWEPTDATLNELITAGKVKGGALLVHASAFNWHLDKLMNLEHPSHFELRYHQAEARKALAAAKEFVLDNSAATD